MPEGRKNRTRSDGLDLAIQQQILLDIESFGDNASAAVVASSREIYGAKGTDLYKAVKRKYRYLTELKAEEPEEYWRLYVQATEVVESKSPPPTHRKSNSAPSPTARKKPSRRQSTSTPSTPSRRKTATMSRDSDFVFIREDYDDVFTISDPEDFANILVPTLQLFRLHNIKDDKGQIHHGYEVLFTGDPRMGTLVTVTLVSATKLVVTVPNAPGSFTHDYGSTTNEQLLDKDKTSEPQTMARATAIDRYTNDPELLVHKYLIDIEQTDETLTNSVVNPGTPRFGPVKPKACFVSGVFKHKSREYPTSELYSSFRVARLEPFPRFDNPQDRKNTSGNLVMDELDSDMHGMNI